MISARKAAAAAALVAAALGATTAPAMATDATGGGDNTQRLVQTPAEQAREAAKMAAAQAALSGRGSATTNALLRAVRGPAVTAAQALPPTVLRWQSWVALGRPLCADCQPGATTPPKSRTLAVAQSPQQKTYYCGPATGFAILRFLGRTKAADNGASLSQAHVAGPDHMRTDINGRTAWSSGLWSVGMNLWLDNVRQGFYENRQSPTNAQFKTALKADIGLGGIPFGVSTYESHNGKAYNNHPAKHEQIGHWIGAIGYSGDAATTAFVDPAGNDKKVFRSGWWDKVKPTFVYDTDYFNKSWVKPHGISW